MRNATKCLKLMCVLAHPDDQSLGMGGTLAAYDGGVTAGPPVTERAGERQALNADGRRLFFFGSALLQENAIAVGPLVDHEVPVIEHREMLGRIKSDSGHPRIHIRLIQPHPVR